ncbi:4415_t:CDS:2 [Funneliformis caledonium]|uniref:4415_t:CDS:1 n=1 Tax=Funneliformis caledonium TaxID=1117310 RepID=A0A9N9IT16_9GLOM|nr:4415_t:CDS:2 [Funneliformis caledonium]
MDRTNDQRRSPPNYNRPRDLTLHRTNPYNPYSSERDNYGSNSHYMSFRGYSDYQMREPPQMPIGRYNEREEESAFRGQVSYGGNTRDQKPYGRPPISPLQSYERRPVYRGGHSYNSYPRPPNRDYGPPMLEEKLAQIKAEGQRLREAELKLNEGVRKSQRELNKSLWELEKVNHNTALATRQVETLCTEEEIEKLEKLTNEKEIAEREREPKILE